jgi:hypothetical protein
MHRPAFSKRNTTRFTLAALLAVFLAIFFSTIPATTNTVSAAPTSASDCNQKTQYFQGGSGVAPAACINKKDLPRSGQDCKDIGLIPYHSSNFTQGNNGLVCYTQAQINKDKNQGKAGNNPSPKNCQAIGKVFIPRSKDGLKPNRCGSQKEKQIQQYTNAHGSKPSPQLCKLEGKAYVPATSKHPNGGDFGHGGFGVAKCGTQQQRKTALYVKQHGNKVTPGLCKAEGKVYVPATSKNKGGDLKGNSGVATCGTQAQADAAKKKNAKDDKKDDPDKPLQLKCETHLTNPLSWFMCPIINGLESAANTMDRGIDALLYVKVGAKDSLFGHGATSNAFRSAWAAFRTLSLSLLVIAGLVMVVAQAAGSELIDAYTIRKVLPRLLIAAVAITLSWALMSFLISLTNDVGFAIRQLIYSPFQGISIHGKSVGVGGMSLALAFGGGALLALGLIGMGTFILAAFLALLIGFVVLMIRQIIIILLVIMAPLGIACYILPGTAKGWTVWKDTLLSMLIVFPVISAFLAAGKVFSVIALNAGVGTFGPGNAFNQIFALVAYFLPYALIPMAFRLAGGAFATITGGIQNKTSGMFGGIKEMRKQNYSNRYRKAQAGELWNNKKWANFGKERFDSEGKSLGRRNFIRGANNLVAGGLANPMRSKLGMTKQGQLEARDVRQRRNQVLAGERAKDPMMATGADDDEFTRGQMYFYDGDVGNMKKRLYNYATSEEYAVRALKYDEAEVADDPEKQAKVAAKMKEMAEKGGAEKYVNETSAKVLSGGKRGMAAAQAAYDMHVATGTAYSGPQDVANSRAMITQGNEILRESLSGKTSSLASRAGRHDLNVGMQTNKDLADMAEHMNYKLDLTQDASTKGVAEEKNITFGSLAKTINERTTSHELGSGKPVAAKFVMSGMNNEIALGMEKAVQGDKNGVTQATEAQRSLTEIKDSLAQAKGGVATAYREKGGDRDRILNIQNGSVKVNLTREGVDDANRRKIATGVVQGAPSDSRTYDARHDNKYARDQARQRAEEAAEEQSSGPTT